MNFAVPVDHRVKNLWKRKKKQVLGPCQRTKKAVRVTVVTVIIGTLRTIPNGLVKGLEKLGVGGQAETIQTIALLRVTKILRRVL